MGVSIFENGSGGRLNLRGPEPYSVGNAGATGDGQTDDYRAILNASARQGSVGAIFFPPGTYRVGTSLTINCQTIFALGATLKPDSGVTVTLAGPVTVAPGQSIIAAGALGTVSITGPIGNAGVFDVRVFGAIGNGVSDDTDGIQRACAAAAGGVVYFPPGTYRVTASIDVGSCTLQGSGDATIIDATGSFTGDYVFESDGTLTQIEELTGTATAGSYSVPFASAPSLSIGDIFVIYNPTNSSFSGFRTDYRAGEWCEVDSISGSTVTAKNQLYASYAAADVDVYRLSPTRPTLQDFRIEGSSSIGLIKLTLARRPLVRNVSASHANNSVVYFDRCVYGGVENCDIANVGDGGDDYGVVFGNCQHMYVRGGNIYSRRHAVTTGSAPVIGCVPCRDIRVREVVLKNDTASGTHCADFHGNTEDSSYEDCTIYGGVTFQGKDNTFARCAITNASQGWVVLSAEILGGTHALVDCTLRTSVDPNGSTRSIVDIGRNNDPITANTTLDVNIVLRGCRVIGTNLSASTSLTVFSNRGTTAKVNFDYTDLTFQVNTLGNVIVTTVVSGTANSDLFRVERVVGIPSTASVFNHSGAAYLPFPHVFPEGLRRTTQTAAYTLRHDDATILADATSAAFTVSLPLAARLKGKRCAIKKIDASANAVTLDPSGTESIDGAANYSLAAQNDAVVVETDGLAWYILGRRV